jgi:hypothetical protein
MTTINYGILLLIAVVSTTVTGTEHRSNGFVNPVISSALQQQLSEDLHSQMPYTQIVSAPLSFLFNGFELGLDRQIGNKESIRFTAGYFYDQRAMIHRFNSDNLREMSSGRFEFQYRKYARDYLDDKNFYVGTYTVFKSIGLDSLLGRNAVPFEQKSAKALSLGVLFGYQYRLNQFMSFDIHLGGGFTPVSRGDSHLAHIPFFSPYDKSINLKSGFNISIKI